MRQSKLGKQWLEQVGEEYLRPPPLPPGTLARAYQRKSKAEQNGERQAVRASVKRKFEKR